MRFMITGSQAPIEGHIDEPLAEIGLRNAPPQHPFKVHNEVESHLIDVVCIDEDDILAPIDGIDSLFFHWYKDTVFSLVSQTFWGFSSPTLPWLHRDEVLSAMRPYRLSSALRRPTDADRVPTA